MRRLWRRRANDNRRMTLTVEAVERATLAALPPDAVEELPGWLLPLDAGTVGRAHSAVPLRHEAPDAALLPHIEQRYRAHGLPPLFRLPVDLPAFDGFQAELRARGYIPSRPTLVMTGTPEAMAAGGSGHGVRLDAAPTDAWSRVYLGEGFDPADGASRVRLLRRAKDALYASASLPPDGDANAEAQLAAVGCACFSGALVGVHGMRTRPRFRGRGLARQLMAAMGAEALRRGVTDAFLQVEVENVLARSLYARIGFAPAWTYVYWGRLKG
jgi:GNAT superfamily N-acetyltransferase